MNILLERFKALPRAGRWLVLLALMLGAFYAIIDPALGLAQKWNVSAQAKLERLSRSGREAAELSAAEGDIKNGVLRFGLVALPGAAKERSDALNRRVGQVLRSHGVTDHTSSVKEMPLGSASFDQQFGSDVRVERLVTELQFEASPDSVAAVLADLERSPEIAAVSRVQIRKASASGQEKKSSSRTVRATLAVEAWQVVRKLKRSIAQ